MDKTKFYDSIRSSVNLTTQNVLGMDQVLDYLEQHEDNLQQAAYIIATAWWETAQTMMPVREAYWLSENWRKKNLRYYPFYGRGYVQITWEYNYKKASDYFGVDFVKNPDLVMEPKYALPILVVGSNEGWFTRKSLDDYIDNEEENDSEELREYKNARRVINGTDKADAIAKLALVFAKGLKKADYRKTTKTENKTIVIQPEKPVEGVVEVPTTTLPEKEKPSVQPSNELETRSMSIVDIIVKILQSLFNKG